MRKRGEGEEGRRRDGGGPCVCSTNLPVCVLKFFLAGCVDDVCVHVHACMYGVYTLLRYSEATRRLSEVEADNGILMRQLQAFMPEVYSSLAC